MAITRFGPRIGRKADNSQGPVNPSSAGPSGPAVPGGIADGSSRPNGRMGRIAGGKRQGSFTGPIEAAAPMTPSSTYTNQHIGNSKRIGTVQRPPGTRNL